ncbi:hypothetical protein GCM10010977_25360 [Citricoccus zhacaiensis]|uniref:Sensor domain-containing protein n=1 Tax=Citricoccus zhacaiensis TaxID=489142 RepID=A0ABQ2M610_9MICC|nr:hypothetical protein [Citricoccus zhacaiensis]GGO47645.1 hypothetical protein GCM10010977_25360 [Citricoccus zhacaiensis]
MTTRSPRTPAIRPSLDSRRLRRPVARMAALGLAGMLVLAGCSGGASDQDGNDAGVPANPHGITAENPSGSAMPTAGADGQNGEGTEGGAGTDGETPTSGTASADPSETEAADARADQAAVGAAAERAASFGFTNQVSATDTEIAATREDARLRQTNSSGTTVEPASCKSPLTAVDWSPILMPGADASRLDFGSETFAGTGTVEVASLEDAGVVEDHLANVERLVADCPELTMTVTDSDLQQSTFDFTARTSASAGEGVDSGLVWTRTPAGGGAETTAHVLIGQTAEHVVMVSFIGGSEVAGEEFTAIAEQILAAAEGAL